MWITQNNGEASVTFSESPGKPGPAMFLQNLSASTKAVAALSPATTATALPLKLKKSGGMGSLSAPLPGGAAATATLLEGDAREEGWQEALAHFGGWQAYTGITDRQFRIFRLTPR